MKNEYQGKEITALKQQHYLEPLTIQLVMYTLIGNIQVIELVKNEQARIIYEFSENEATAYLLQNGSIIILPCEGDSSMLFQSAKEFGEINNLIVIL